MSELNLQSKDGKTPVVFMFSGQGSHYYHMAADLFESNPVFRDTMFTLDEIAMAVNGKSILKEIYHSEKTAKDWFDETIYTHPAIVMVEYALAQVLAAEGVTPDVVLSTSMGSFAGAAVAGTHSIEEALSAAIRQAEALSLSGVGMMIAIVENVDLFHETPELYENSQLGGVNFDGHFVVTSTCEKGEFIESFLRKQYKYQILNITTPFHSSLIDPSENNFMEFLRHTDWGLQTRKSDVPMVCCINGELIDGIEMAYTWQAIRQPILFQKAIRHLETKGKFHYIDVGPSGTLAAFVKYNVDRQNAPQIVTTLSPRGSNQKRVQAAIDGYFERDLAPV